MNDYIGPYWRRRRLFTARRSRTVEALCWLLAFALPFFAFYVLPRVWP